MPDPRQSDAAVLIGSEVYKEAMANIKGKMIKELLTATTPEDREKKWHEHNAMVRVERQLQQWAAIS